MENTLTSETKKCAIYVADDNGWYEGCPDFQGVFFGAARFAPYNYVGPWEYGGGMELGACGYIIVEADHARSVLDDLNTTGDWVTTRDNEDGVEERPVYEMREI